MRPHLLAAVAGLAAAACADATSGPQASINAGVLPATWGYSGQGPTNWAGKYVVGTASGNAHAGVAALGFRGTDSANFAHTGVGQQIRADNYRGKRVRLTAWVRHVNLAGPGNGIWMRIDGSFSMLAFDDFSTRSLRGTADWHQIEIILDVPENAIGIALGASIKGSGDLYYDDMKLEIIPATGLTTNLGTGPTPSGFDAATAYAANTRFAPANMDFEQ